MSPRLFPLFLKLKDRPCLVVGAGTVAEVKIASLLDAGANLTVIAPRATDRVARHAADQEIRWIRRAFQPADLDGKFLAIAATSDAEVNRAVFEEAQRLGVLCNSVDDPPHCDFYFPAVVRRGDLQIAVSTAGKSPAFAQRIRDELDRALDASLGPLLERIGGLRRRILDGSLPSAVRSRMLRLLAWHDACNLENCPARMMSAGNQFPDDSKTQLNTATGGVEQPMTAARAGHVYLVGAGPGDPELLTLKASSLIGSADMILHDDLVAPAILALAGSKTVVVSVGKRCGKKRSTQQETNDRMISAALRGLSVVRLKGGDPLIFGRLGEEIDALRAAGIPHEVVPGISAGFAAAASLGVPLTDRHSSARILITSAHRAQDKDLSLCDDQANPNLENTTLMIYMPGPDLSPLRRQLLDAGLNPATPCVVVSRATTPEQRNFQTSLEDLHLLPAMGSPSLVLVGWTLVSSGGRDSLIAEREKKSKEGYSPPLAWARGSVF